MRSIGETIRLLRTEKGLTTRELADKVNLSFSTIGMYEQDRRKPRYEVLETLADFFNVDMNFLLGKSDIRNAYNITDQTIYKKANLPYLYIPLYGPICCGNGGFNDDNILEYIPVPSAGLADHKDYFCQYAVGDSMLEKIEEGDLLVFEKCSVPEINGIGCFCINENTSTCKKYVISGGIHMLMPLNSAYDPIVVDSLAFRCIGNLKKIIRSV